MQVVTHTYDSVGARARCAARGSTRQLRRSPSPRRRVVRRQMAVRTAAAAMGKDQPCRVKLRIWRYQPRPPADAPSGAPDAPGDAPPGAARGSAAAARPGEAAAAVRAASAGSGDSSQSGGGAASAPAAAGALPGPSYPNPNLGGARPAWPPPLDAPLLTIADAVLCSEMGVHFSPCGRYLAACVACRVQTPPAPPPAAACGGARRAVRLGRVKACMQTLVGVVRDMHLAHACGRVAQRSQGAWRPQSQS